MAAGSTVRLDLSGPGFQDVFVRLEAAELKQVVAGLRRLRGLEWTQFYRHTGFKWEAIDHLTTPKRRQCLSSASESVRSSVGIQRR